MKRNIAYPFLCLILNCLSCTEQFSDPRQYLAYYQQHIKQAQSEDCLNGFCYSACFYAPSADLARHLVQDDLNDEGGTGSLEEDFHKSMHFLITIKDDESAAYSQSPKNAMPETPMEFLISTEEAQTSASLIQEEARNLDTKYYHVFFPIPLPDEDFYLVIKSADDQVFLPFEAGDLNSLPILKYKV